MTIVYKRRRFRALWLLSALCVTALAGCASTPDEATTNGDASVTEDAPTASRNTAAAIEEFSARSDNNGESDRSMPEVPPELDDMILDENSERRSARFDVAASGVPLAQFLDDLSDIANTNILLSESIAGDVTLRMRNVTVTDVMRAVQDQLGIAFEQTSYGYRVSGSQIQTRMFRVNYLDISRLGSSATGVSSGQIGGGTGQASQINTENATDFWGTLENTLSLMMGDGGGRQLVVNPQTGLIVVRAQPRELQAIGDFLYEAELALQQQVIIEARILEVRLSESFESGIDWSILGSANGLEVGAGIDGNPFASPNDNGLEGGFNFSLDLQNFNSVIRALRTQGEVEVLSSPRISTVNNQKAVIKVGSEEQFVTVSSVSSETEEGTQTVTPTFGLQPYFSGISLDVTPQIQEEESIILHVHPSVIRVESTTKSFTVQGESYNLPLANSTIRETDSVIRADNGQVVVIGGLLQNSVTNQSSGVPNQSNGLLGWLFGQQRSAAERSELIILLRPVIADPATMQDDIENTTTRLLQP